MRRAGSRINIFLKRPIASSFASGNFAARLTGSVSGSPSINRLALGKGGKQRVLVVLCPLGVDRKRSRMKYCRSSYVLDLLHDQLESECFSVGRVKFPRETLHAKKKTIFTPLHDVRGIATRLTIINPATSPTTGTEPGSYMSASTPINVWPESEL